MQAHVNLEFQLLDFGISLVAATGQGWVAAALGREGRKSGLEVESQMKEKMDNDMETRVMYGLPPQAHLVVVRNACPQMAIK